MFMMCWNYCIPFFKGLFFLLSPLLLILSMFVLKRGVNQRRPALRQFAFLMIFVSFLKSFTLDIYMLRDKILCNDLLFSFACNGTGFKSLQILGLVLLAASSFVVFKIYLTFVKERKVVYHTAKKLKLRLLANIGLWMAVFLMLWLATPWVGYLTVGSVPKFFVQAPWGAYSIINAIVLGVCFWRYEDCVEHARAYGKKATKKVWTPKDTLWIAVFLLLITTAFFYASDDVLSKASH